jgi:hypothetical protein
MNTHLSVRIDAFLRRHPRLLVLLLCVLAATGFVMTVVESGRSILVYEGF